MLSSRGGIVRTVSLSTGLAVVIVAARWVEQASAAATPLVPH